MKNSNYSNNNYIILIVAIILVGLNLRPSMAAIGPLLTAIRESVPMSYTAVSLLTVLPVLAMGVAMLVGSKLTDYLGEHKAVLIAVSMIGTSSLCRFWANDTFTLIFTAVVAGCGISVIQAIVPGIIKRNFAHLVPLMMGLYVTSIMGGAAIAAALSPLVASVAGWQVALSIWAGLAAIALILWFVIKDKIGKKVVLDNDIGENVNVSFATSQRAWLLGIFFGLGTSFYTCVLAWLPPYYMDLGYKDTNAGLMLAFVCTMEVISGLVLPGLASRSLDRRWVIYVTLFSTTFGFGGIALAPDFLPLVWASLLGIGIGGIFPLTLIVTLDHIKDVHLSTKLVTFVQSIGYTIAAFSPLAAGAIKDLTNGFTGAWLSLVIVTLLMLAMATRFNPRKYSSIFGE